MDFLKVDEQWEPTVLVIGPAGAKVFLEIGILKSMEEHQAFKKIKKIAGVSVGSIIGLLIVCGLSIDKIYEKAKKINIFHDLINLKLNDIHKKVGILSGDTLRKALHTDLMEKYGFIPTMKELYELTGIDFISVTTNLEIGGPEYISKNNFPNLSCIEAAMRSIIIPMIFDGDSVYIDGAFSDPYPVDIFLPNENVLGISVYAISPSSKKSILSYILKSLTVSLDQLRRKNILNSKSSCRHIRVGYNRKADLLYATDDEKFEMFQIGFDHGEMFYESMASGKIDIYLHDIEDPIKFIDDL